MIIYPFKQSTNGSVTDADSTEKCPLKCQKTKKKFEPDAPPLSTITTPARCDQDQCHKSSHKNTSR